MHRRLQVWALGAAAVALLGIASVQGHDVLAQDATPPASSTAPATDKAAARAAAYDEFVADLAASLGIGDPATVDAAIKETLTQRVDEALAAGTISANAATELKERIEAGEIGGPFSVGRGGRHGGPFDGRGGHRDHDRDTESTVETPVATPAALA